MKLLIPTHQKARGYARWMNGKDLALGGGAKQPTLLTGAAGSTRGPLQ